MAQPILRRATEADIPVLSRIFLAGLTLSLPGRDLSSQFYVYERDVAPPDGKLYRRLSRELREEHFVVAEVDAEVAGYVTWVDPKLENEEGKEAGYKRGEITFLFVHPSMHGRGLGSRLIQHAQASAQVAFKKLETTLAVKGQDSVAVMGVFCFSKNQPGLRAYERRGFVKASTKIEEDVGEEVTWLEWRTSLHVGV